MNKQELIDELKRISLEKQHKALTHPESKNYYEGMVMAYSQVVHMVNTVLKLDEPQKPVVPKFVAEWFEDNKHALDLAIFTKIRELDGKNYPHETDFENWLDNAENNPIENLIRMKDGYEVEESKWVVNEGDLVIRKGEHEAKVYFVESVDDDGILLVNGIKDEFFTDLDERSVDEESINYFYENFRLLAKKENLEVEKVEV
ncbi:DUF1642 domain-containing protein [Enterococcus faecium]|uniref:DUF1642 domain-containing protein n=1 Tax=Enterococcus faecium TaxID=1352 RepID=UPI002DBA6E62|nr:DUF1642 domain-containing protein [Enterococcus faecium]MEB6013751.1 DUF1642 domain-containing protein [Enterococcus faecium]